MRRVWIITFIVLSVTATLAIAASNQSPPMVDARGAAQITPAEAGQIDQLFAKWSKSDSPGASLAVIRDGKIIYSHGYGLASLEYSIPNSPSTVFHMASVSKQFTAFAIHLLAQDGKLSLDDDIRKYLPELHDFGKTITIRHLLHHTSGLRDQWDLLALAGWRFEDVITDDDILHLMWRQMALNFEPGKQELYSNTGYTLLGQIVKRVSGLPLSAFCKQRIFVPLGMTHTHFQDDYSTVVKNRAYSYLRPNIEDDYKYAALSYSTTGPSSLFTTVGDMALWDQNFYSGGVGGEQLVADMQAQGVLNNGKVINYASGLIIDKYRGLHTVEHSGGDAGYRTNILRFPDQHFSVVVLANAGDLDPTGLSRRIADIFLSTQLSGPAPRADVVTLPEVKLDPTMLAAYVGNYELADGFVLSFTREGDQLFAQGSGQRKFPVFASSDNTVFWKTVDAQFTFDKPSDDGRVMGGTHHQNGRDIPAKRIAIDPLTPAQIKAYAGDYYSPELGVLYTVTFRDGALHIRYPRGDIALREDGVDSFSGTFPIQLIHFATDDSGVYNGFTVSTGRVLKLRFDKVTIRPAAGG